MLTRQINRVYSICICPIWRWQYAFKSCSARLCCSYDLWRSVAFQEDTDVSEKLTVSLLSGLKTLVLYLYVDIAPQPKINQWRHQRRENLRSYEFCLEDLDVRLYRILLTQCTEGCIKWIWHCITVDCSEGMPWLSVSWFTSKSRCALIYCCIKHLHDLQSLLYRRYT